MAKTVNETHKTGEKGVIKFWEYCNQHAPYIIFRPEIINDFGIDGEIELTRRNENNKEEPTGHILKIQIKSTKSENSYISNRGNNTFEFRPRKDDLDYWKKYDLDVLLIIYDDLNDKLYCKKIDKVDSAKVTRRKNPLPIEFNVIDNALEIGIHNFLSKFEDKFRKRIDFGIKERIALNLFPFLSHPKFLYTYTSKFKSKKEIFKIITNDEAPFFSISGDQIFTFTPILPTYKTFADKVLVDNTCKDIKYKDVVSSQILRNHYITLINEYFRSFCYDKYIRYSRKYSRYFFSRKGLEDVTTVNCKTRKTKKQKEEKVVTFHSYANGVLKFFRHNAFEIEYMFSESKLYLILTPKYYFTSDGKETLTPERISKLTSTLMKKEWNPQTLNRIHFYWDYLTGGKSLIDVYSFGEVKISIDQYVVKEVPFGIAIDQVNERKLGEEKTVLELDLFNTTT